MNNYRTNPKILNLCLLASLLLTVLFSSCRKGENDSFITLRSRKARLCGDWVVTKKTSTLLVYQIINGVETLISTDSKIYDGSTETLSSLSNSPNATPNVSISNYIEKYSFKKDGTFTYITGSESEPQTHTGVWAFSNKNESQEIKNKEGIILQWRGYSMTSNNVTYNSTQTGGNQNMFFYIDQLKNKEIVLINKVKLDDTFGKIDYENYITLTVK